MTLCSEVKGKADDKSRCQTWKNGHVIVPFIKEFQKIHGSF